MRILFSSVGGYGHLIPLLPLAVATRDAGHDVRVATARAFHRVIAEAGLRPVEAGGSIRDAVDELAAQDPSGPRDRAPLIFGAILPRRAIADLAGIIEDFEPDLIVYEALNAGAAIAAEIAGVHAVCHGLGRLSSGPSWTAMSSAWHATARDFGVEAADGDEFFGHPYLDICPLSLQPRDRPSTALVLPLRPESLRQQLPLPEIAVGDAQARARPLIYLTLGTAFGTDQALETAVEGLSSLDANVLVATGSPRASLESWNSRANVTIESWVAQSALLPHVDLVVSHGGSGTMLGALSEGLPQLLLPQGADQFTNSQTIMDAELGLMLAPEVRTAEAIALAADEVLRSRAMLERARGVADEIAKMPSCGQVVGLLEQL